MARKSETYNLDENLEIKIYEIKAFDVYKIIKKLEKIDIEKFEESLSLVIECLPFVTTMTEAQFKDLAPSEMIDIGNIFLKVNSPFLGILESVGIKDALKTQFNTYLQNFKKMALLIGLESENLENPLQEQEIQQETPQEQEEMEQEPKQMVETNLSH